MMKYTKKMKLVDITESDVNNTNSYRHNNELPLNDTDIAAPRVLSTLDATMNSILNRKDITDSEKWLLYNQTLHKYLSFIKNNRTSSALDNMQLHNNQNQSTIDGHFPQNPSKKSTPGTILQDQQSKLSNDQNQSTLDPFTASFMNNDISGIFPMRDSIDSIKQPIVRQFFEKVREKEKNKTPTIDIPTISPMNISSSSFHELHPTARLPPQSDNRKRKSNRVQKRGATTSMSCKKPRKVRINLRDYNKSSIWESSNAK